MSTGRTIAVVLARAGSKGVPGKNTLLIAGRPCVEWTIEAAQQAQSVDSVLVSSDDPQVLEIGERMGAICVLRRPTDATDTARVDTALRHCLEDWGGDYANVVMLYANVPVRPDGLIDRAITLLIESGCDSVQSYAGVGKYHPWWQATLASDGQVRPWEGEILNHGVYRRQDLPPSLVPDGGVVAMMRRSLFEPANDGPHGFLGKDHRGIETREGEVVDIDSPVDVLVAGSKLRGINTEITESTERRGRDWGRGEKKGGTELLESELTREIIGAAIEVHKSLGPGLLESVYEACLCEELLARSIPFTRQVRVPVQYKGVATDIGYRLDLLVADQVVVELKAIDALMPIHEAQLMTYLRLSGLRVGLLMNFNVRVLKDGIVRRVI